MNETKKGASPFHLSPKKVASPFPRDMDPIVQIVKVADQQEIYEGE